MGERGGGDRRKHNSPFECGSRAWGAALVEAIAETPVEVSRLPLATEYGILVASLHLEEERFRQRILMAARQGH
jgi:hypothetical protein